MKRWQEYLISQPIYDLAVKELERASEAHKNAFDRVMAILGDKTEEKQEDNKFNELYAELCPWCKKEL